MYSLSVSIVTYAPSMELLYSVLDSFRKAVQHACDRDLLENVNFLIIDNGPGNQWKSGLLEVTGSIFSPVSSLITSSVISGHGNIGFGAAHNLALSKSRSYFHLVMNPDVILKEESITECLKFMTQNPEVGALSPYAENGSGEQQFLCKRFPSVLDLFLRGLMPPPLQNMFKNRLSRYEMRDLCSKNEAIIPVRIISGCFMFLRRNKIDEAGRFSSKYFLYFEDFDLSLRLARVSRLAYVPEVKIVHFGGEAGRKGLRHIMMFVKSGSIFFREYGWKVF